MGSRDFSLPEPSGYSNFLPEIESIPPNVSFEGFIRFAVEFIVLMEPDGEPVDEFEVAKMLSPAVGL